MRRKATDGAIREGLASLAAEFTKRGLGTDQSHARLALAQERADAGWLHPDALSVFRRIEKFNADALAGLK